MLHPRAAARASGQKASSAQSLAFPTGSRAVVSE